VAAQKPADILFLVSAAFSLAAAGFFPALTLGIFWKRASKWGAILGMIAGFGVTFYYMATTQPWLRGVFGVTSPVELWCGILPISAGVFGVPLGFAVIILVSLLTPAPRREIQELVEHVRYPSLAERRDPQPGASNQNAHFGGRFFGWRQARTSACGRYRPALAPHRPKPSP